MGIRSIGNLQQVRGVSGCVIENERGIRTRNRSMNTRKHDFLKNYCSHNSMYIHSHFIRLNIDHENAMKIPIWKILLFWPCVNSHQKNKPLNPSNRILCGYFFSVPPHQIIPVLWT